MLILTFFLGCRTQAASPPVPPVEVSLERAIHTMDIHVSMDCTRYIADVTPEEIVIVCFDAGNGSHDRQVIATPKGIFDVTVTHTPPRASPP